MCFIISKNPKEKDMRIAEKDIVCYKVVFLHKGNKFLVK